MAQTLRVVLAAVLVVMAVRGVMQALRRRARQP
jgi:translation elongation factor EF-G